MSRATKSLLVGTLVLSILTAWAVTDAFATDDVTICIRYETNFTDAALGDYYANSAPAVYNAIRPQVRVYDNDSQTVIYNSYTSSAYCTPILNLNWTHDFQIKVYAAALLSNSNEIKVFDNYQDPSWHSQVVAANWNPSGDGMYTFVYQYNSTYKVSNVLAAAGWAVDRRPAGLSNLEINYFTDPCPGAAGQNCLGIDNGVHRIFIGPGSIYKSTVAHETGHEIAHQKNDNDGNTNDCSYVGPAPDCGNNESGLSDHCDYCLEYQSCAAWEGFADFYGVAAWNNENQTDCDYTMSTSCEIGGNLIATNNCCTSCFGRGIESDWVHFWWDMYQDEGYTMADIAQIYNLSNPENWSPWYSVYYIIKDAAMDFGVSESVWDSLAADNGIDH